MDNGNVKYYGAPDGTVYYFDENGEIVESNIKVKDYEDDIR